MSRGDNRLAVLAAQIRAADQDFNRAAITMAAHALAAGRALNEAKQLVAHGKWRPWLRENCGLSPRTATRYMGLAASGLKTATVAVLGIRAASEALGRARMESGDVRDVPAVPTEASTDRHAVSQTAGETSSASDPESSAGDTVIRAGDPQDHNLIERQPEAARQRESSFSNRASAGLTPASSTDQPQLAPTPHELQPAEPEPARSSPDRQNGGSPQGGLVKDNAEIKEAATCAKRADREQARENSRQFAQLLMDQIDRSQWRQVIVWLGHCSLDDVIAFIRQRQLV